MIKVNASSHRCATCASWFGGVRVFDTRGTVLFNGSPANTGLCKHPFSGRTNRPVQPSYVCRRWTKN